VPRVLCGQAGRPVRREARGPGTGHPRRREAHLHVSLRRQATRLIRSGALAVLILVLGLAVLALPDRLAAQGDSAPSSVLGEASVSLAPRTPSSCRPFSLLSRAEPEPCSEFHLDGAGDDADDQAEPAAAASRDAAISAKRRQLLLATVVSAGAIAGGAINAFAETPHQS